MPRGALRLCWRSVLLFLGAALLASGCSSRPRIADIVIVNGGEPESLDPAIATGQADQRIIRCLFEGLTRLNPTNAQPMPGLADRWEISTDRTLYRFHLRPTARWSTGEPLLAADVVYSWRRALDPRTACDYAGNLFPITNAEEFFSGQIKDPEQVGVRALNSETVEIQLVAPTAYFLDLCATPTLAVVPRAAIEKWGDRWLMHPPVPTSGPYVLDSWRLNDKVRVRRNENYWDAGGVLNRCVDFLPVESATAALNLYLGGEADILWDKTLTPNDLMDVLGAREDCHRFNYLGVFFLRFNVTRKPFDDVRVRQALALVIDRRRIVERITRGGETVANHLTPDGLGEYQAPDGLGYDPNRARRLLADAGFPKGRDFPPVQYLFSSGQLDRHIGIELQAMMANELGIKVELRPAEWKVYLDALSRLDYDVGRSSWIGDYPDPNTFLDLWMSHNGNNRTGWGSAAYDRLLFEANRETEPRRRSEKLRAAETMVLRVGTPVVPVFFYQGMVFYRPQEIEGVFGNLLDEHPVWAIRKKSMPLSDRRH